jgi:diapolycopene oxygenase
MRVIVIGAGVAGLASACRLAAAGHQVSVFERASHVGGKAAEAVSEGFRFDLGPSLFTLPEQLDAVFHDAGKIPRDYYEYTRLDTCCHYFFSDGTALRADANPSRFATEIERVIGEPRAAVLDYLEKARELYDSTAPFFLGHSLHRLSAFTSGTALAALARLPVRSLFSTMHEQNRRAFKDPRLVQLFNRYATYNGSSPFRAPGILTQIPHLEHNLGAYFPKGGMAAIPAALARLGSDLGVEFFTNTGIDRVTHDAEKVSGVRTSAGEIAADVVVCAGDVLPAYRKLLPDLPAPEAVLNQERSSSGVIFYWGIRKTFAQLDVHNVFFSADYEREFEEIFVHKTVPADPTVYVHVSSKVEASDAPAGCENWFVMVNVPSDDGQAWPELIATLRQRVLDRLTRALGQPIEPLIATESLLEPRLIEQRTSSAGGALYGPSSNHRQAAFLRHPNFSRQLRGLYFCGGSVHPGGGIPLCLSSAKIVAREVARSSSMGSRA